MLQVKNFFRQVVLAGILLSAFAFSCAAADWQTYRNHEHGFSVEYPADLFTQRGPSENWEGVRFSTQDGRRFLSVYGFNNGDELPLKQVRDIIIESYSDREVTYQRLKDNWFVLSGYEYIDDEKMIFYHRLASNKAGTRFAVFEFVWPVSQRDEIEPLVKRMSHSLTTPRPN
ncbi:MAG: hypothetical protein COC23_00295 [Hyphomicrobiales bacterium]|nr:MAG: hypothetical protein COC23_00295 [Hyphomicrobiales bacterium]